VLRRYCVLAVAVIVVGGLALLPVSLLPAAVARAAAWAPWGQPVASSSLAPEVHRSQPARSAGPHVGARPGEAEPGRSPAGRQVPDTTGLASCEDKIESGAAGGGLPRLAIVGASFTAGVGPGNPLQSWAVLLARQLRWDAVVYGDPGAGYVRPGVGRQGPMAAEVARIGLRALKPALVIVQAGHDDIGVPARLEEQRVRQLVAAVRAAAPQARIALLTVFGGRTPSAAAYRTDRAIVSAGTAADHQLIIMDPLAAGWTFARARGGLHPSAAGDAWIAQQVDTILREHGVLAEPAGRGAVSCDAGIPVRPRRR
jgi:GDSL-like Lipase/Acylhydrolase family